jgi:hypothetical protein
MEQVGKERIFGLIKGFVGSEDETEIGACE